MATVHVLPLRDVVEHHVPGGLDGHGPSCPDCTDGQWLGLEALDGNDADCPCGPTPELVPNDDGPDGWVYVHHSLDGREHSE